MCCFLNVLPQVWINIHVSPYSSMDLPVQLKQLNFSCNQSCSCLRSPQSPGCSLPTWHTSILLQPQAPHPAHQHSLQPEPSPLSEAVGISSLEYLYVCVCMPVSGDCSYRKKRCCNLSLICWSSRNSLRNCHSSPELI